MSKEESESPVPVVLLSYSHDTPEHKRWVGQLATKLVRSRIEVILDQWDTGPGDNLPKFMERAVARADRVLMICTEPYVRKADEGKGGVGYEAMIVTGELIRGLETRKFIPVIRQGDGKMEKPKCIDTRYHINLSEDRDFESRFEELLRELHQVPVLPKPKLGENPFQKDVKRMTVQGASSDYTLAIKLPVEAHADAGKAYAAALELAQRSDTLGWRKLTQRITSRFPNALVTWQSDRRNNIPSDVEDLPQMVLEGVSCCAPAIALALAGVESRQPQFSNQIGLIDEFLHPSGWERTGSTLLVQLPDAIVFVYQALLGAVAMQTQQAEISYRLAQTELPDFYAPSKLEPLFRRSCYTGWPEPLNHTVTIAWKFLVQLPEHWHWLSDVFGDPDSYKAAVSAHYMLLNVIEFLDVLDKAGDISDARTGYHLSVPVCFAAMNEANQRKALRYFKDCLPFVASLWRKIGLPADVMAKKWKEWIAICRFWVAQVYNRIGFANILHANLPELLAKM